MRTLVLFLLLIAPRLAAQQPDSNAPTQPSRPLTLQPALKPPVADTGIFSPIPLPPPNDVRAADGSPGPRYWQQRADYSIKATLDTAAKRITGTEEIHYTNNSPDTLRFIWMQVDQNLFRPGSTGSLLFAAESRFGGAGFAGGFDIASITQSMPAPRTPPPRPRRGAGATAGTDGHGTPPVSLSYRVNDTMMYVELAQPLAPGGTTILDVAYSFNVPEHGADRMGREGNLYEIAQWYPRMAVYDDVHGWNTDPYLGQGEFYLEYGDIDYEVTVPAGYLVAGTGVLQNPEQVLTPAERSRLAAAAKSDSTVAIVTQEELDSGAARPRRDGTLTWRFRADRVRDVAWAASPDYRWDASSWEGTLAQAFYRDSAKLTWEDAAKMSRYSILEYSTKWFRYPYPQITAVEGPVSGMEYPMVAMEAPAEDKPDLYNVITHEIGHMWYPMTVGSDERRYAWMDEGFNTFINTFSEQDYWSRDDSDTRRSEIRFVTGLDQSPTAQPIMTPANRYRTTDNLGSLAYVKPSIMLLALRSKVLGPEVFDTAFREYTRRWAFKHPQPADFFRTMEEVSGRDLSWFWRGFFYTTAALDQSVESVKSAADGGSLVTIRSLGAAVMPVELELGYGDGTSQTIKLPVEIWYGGNRYVYRVPPGKTIVRARVNPDGMFPDVNPANDGWTAPAGTTP
ncbi:MAG: M1 family metallopeptidase [Gemmatimonadales bacterium]